MTNSDKAIREIAEKHFPCVGTRNDREYRKMEQDALVSSITALISEHYYPKDMVRWTFNQRFMACGHTGFDSSILELDLEYWNEHIKGKENER